MLQATDEIALNSIWTTTNLHVTTAHGVPKMFRLLLVGGLGEASDCGFGEASDCGGEAAAGASSSTTSTTLVVPALVPVPSSARALGTHSLLPRRWLSGWRLGPLRVLSCWLCLLSERLRRLLLRPLLTNDAMESRMALSRSSSAKRSEMAAPMGAWWSRRGEPTRGVQGCVLGSNQMRQVALLRRRVARGPRVRI